MSETNTARLKRLGIMDAAIKGKRNGKSLDDIAKDAGIGRSSVYRALEAKSITKIIEKAEEKLTYSATKAANVMVDLLDEEDPGIRFKAAYAILQGTGVLRNKTESKIEVNVYKNMSDMELLERIESAKQQIEEKIIENSRINQQEISGISSDVVGHDLQDGGDGEQEKRNQDSD